VTGREVRGTDDGGIFTNDRGPSAGFEISVAAATRPPRFGTSFCPYANAQTLPRPQRSLDNFSARNP